jgi:hypothetical protein
MGFFSLFLVASMPIVQVLLIGVVGAYLASGYSNVLTTSARRDMNKVSPDFHRTLISHFAKYGNGFFSSKFIISVRLCLLSSPHV